MSDWTARPLTQRQMHYAALDAFVLPRLFDKLCQELGEAKSQQLLRQHTTTFNRVSDGQQEGEQADKEQAQQQQPDNSGLHPTQQTPRKRHREDEANTAGFPAVGAAAAGVVTAAAGTPTVDATEKWKKAK